MPPTNKEMTQKLQEIFHRPGLTVIPGGTTPFHAILAEEAGYEAFYQSGAMTHMWLIGWSDMGTLTTMEFAQNANRITKTINIPMIADADTGGGTALNTYRTVQEYIMAGVAGCHIEDVEYPKGVVTSVQRPTGRGHDGEYLISIEEAVGKFKAAIAAKKELDPNFVIIARSDARLNVGDGGFEEVLKRAKAYEEAGVDVIMFEGLQSWDECKFAIESVKAPAFCNVHMRQDGTRVPLPSMEQREKDGEKIYLAVTLSLQPEIQAAWEMLVDFKKRGMNAVQDWEAAQEKKPEELRRGFGFGSIRKYREIEETYLPKSKAGYPPTQ